MKTIKINQKNYPIPELTFRHLPMMERCGLSIMQMVSGHYIFTTVQVFTALVVGCDTDEADRLLEQHILGGGDVTSIFEAFADAIDESPFFSKILENQEKDTPDQK